MKSSSSAVKGLQTNSCPPEYHLLSCGMKYNESESHSYRFAHPSKQRSDTCVCFSIDTAQCVAWCTKSAIELQVISSRPIEVEPRDSLRILRRRSTDSRNVTTAICPSGSRVIGCHVTSSHIYKNKIEYYTGYYPKDDLSGCICSYYNDENTSCVASCSRRVRADRHEIRKNYGVGLINVTCSESNFVMGCGVNPDHGNEGWYRTAWVDSIDSCACYDEKGATCFAVCGRFNSSTERRWPQGRWGQERMESGDCTSDSPNASVTSFLPPFVPTAEEFSARCPMDSSGAKSKVLTWFGALTLAFGLLLA